MSIDKPARPRPRRRALAPASAAPGLAALAHRNLPLLLLQAREQVMARFRPVLNAHGLTEQQWRVLRALQEFGPLEPRQIGEVCRISSPSLAGVLARMDDLGLVLRERLAHDQRRVMVRNSPRSQALALAIAPDIEAQYQQLEQQLGADRVAGLYAALDDLVKRLADGGDGGDGGDDGGESAGRG